MKSVTCAAVSLAVIIAIKVTAGIDVTFACAWLGATVSAIWDRQA